MIEKDRFFRIVMSEVEGIEKPLTTIEILTGEQVEDSEDIDDTTPLYAYDELTFLGEGSFYEGIGRVTDFLENGPSIDTVMNPRRPFEDELGLKFGYTDEEEIIIVDSNDDLLEEEFIIFESPQTSQRPN